MTTPKIKPIGNRVLVRRIEVEEKLKGGLLLPDNSKKKQEQAEVISLGTGKIDDNGKVVPIPVKIGDVILVEKYAGQEVSVDGNEFTILRTDDIIAVVEA